MLKQGTRLGKYEIVRPLGSGGMADVYEAVDTSLNRRVALKVLPPEFARDSERAERFRKEILHSAQLEHPHIVRVYDVGKCDGLYYYTMALLPGGDLKHRIGSRGLRSEEALQITRQMAEALSAAHDKGFVHRDVKPENILFDGGGRAVLTDMGIARAMSAGTRMTKTGMSIGTPHYMSPEQARGNEVDGRSDLYSLGVVLYEMLTGSVPFDAQDSYAIGIMHINDPPPPLPSALGRYQGLLDRMLAKSPSDRFASAQKFTAALDTLLSGGAVNAFPPLKRQKTEVMSARNAPERRRGLHPMVGVVLGVLAAVTVVLGGLYLMDGDLHRLTSNRSRTGFGGGGGFHAGHTEEVDAAAHATDRYKVHEFEGGGDKDAVLARFTLRPSEIPQGLRPIDPHEIRPAWTFGTVPDSNPFFVPAEGARAIADDNNLDPSSIVEFILGWYQDEDRERHMWYVAVQMDSRRNLDLLLAAFGREDLIAIAEDGNWLIVFNTFNIGSNDQKHWDTAMPRLRQFLRRVGAYEI